MELIFPLSDSLWNVTAIFNMETPSDTDRALNPGYGIWFSAFYWSQDSIQDTVSLDSFRLVTKIDEEITIDTTTTWVEDIVNVRTEDTIRVFGLDTFVTRVVRFDSIIRTDDTFPYTVMNMEAGATAFWYTVGIFDTLTQTLYEDSVRPFFYDNFIQFDFGFWDYSDWGWHYKGWVVSPNVNRDALGEITPPAYRVNTSPLDSLIPGIEGGLLTTGTFTDVSSPDDSNPYAKGPRIPPIAGEDFIENLPAGAFTADGLVPDATGNSGTVFITLEPDNFSTDTTNFPLFVLVRKIPTLRDSIFETAMADQQLFFMRTLTQVNDYTRGFPKIVVDIRRF
jgi:hypothetical protein